MNSPARWRFRAEVGLATVMAVLAILTAVWPDWIEGLTGLSPDHGDGAAEWVVTFIFAMAALIAGGVARWELRRARPAS